MKLLRLLLFPFSILYGIGVILRNLAYDLGLINSQKFDLPIISIGNLSVGGSGKSPMTEYLVRLLKDKYKIATLSRGYGRKTSGFLMVNADATSTETGDEPLQFKRKFRDISVAVCENRVKGISQLEKDHELIILDDAFQHRAVKPGLSILLFEYKSFYELQWLLPTGDLREPMSGKKRADILVISKCPKVISLYERQAIEERLNRNNPKAMFFSYLEYGNLIPLNENSPVRLLSSLNDTSRIILLTGIANALPLLEELRSHGSALIHHEYPDHHPFRGKNIAKLVSSFQALDQGDNLIITTEKDAQRLNLAGIREQLIGLPVYYLPVEAEFQEADKTLFNKLIEEYASKSALIN